MSSKSSTTSSELTTPGEQPRTKSASVADTSPKNKESGVNSRLKNLEMKLPFLEERVNSIQQKNIELLGLFTAIFTFISIEFQLSKNFSYPEFIIFTSLFAGILFLFILLLQFAISKELSLKNVSLLGLILLVCLGVVIKTTNALQSTIAEAPKYLRLDQIQVGSGAGQLNISIPK